MQNRDNVEIAKCGLVALSSHKFFCYILRQTKPGIT